MGALSGLASSALATGTEAWVDTVGDFFCLRLSALTPDSITVVNANVEGWVSVGAARGAQCNLAGATSTWSVDASNISGVASDENTGIDDAHPLKTHAECARRTWGAFVPEGSKMIVRHLSNDLAGARAIYNVFGGSGIIFDGAVPDAVSNLFGFFNIVGVPSVVYSGTMSAVVQTAAGVAGDNHFTDALTPAFSNATGRLWKRTNGTKCGFWPQKDLGSNVTRVSCAMQTTGRKVLANADSYSILQLPTLRDVTFACPQVGEFPTMIQQVAYATAATFGSAFKNGPAAFMHCDMTLFAGNGVMENGIGMYNCRNPFVFSDTSAMQQGAFINGGLADSSSIVPQWPPAQGRFTADSGSGASAAYISFQGVNLTLDHNCDVAEGQLSFYDNVDCLLLPNALARIEVTLLGGSGNTGKLVKVTGSGCQAVVGTYAAGATSDVSPFQLNAAVAATPALVDFATKDNCIVAA